MYVNGIGRTKFGKLAESLPELMKEATDKALEDASLGIKDIGAAYIANFNGSAFQKQIHMNSLFSSLYGLDIPAFRIETACAAGASALYNALLALQKHDNVLVVGVEKMNDVPGSEAIEALAMAGDRELDQKEGLIFPAAYALIASEHFRKHGTTTEDLDRVSFKNHENANLNENAHFYGKTITMEKIAASLVICSPLRLFDCSPLSDGAAAVIVSKNKTEKSVKVLGTGAATDSLSLAQRPSLTTLPAAKKASAEAYKQAGKTAKDIQLFEVHDCFTINELVAMEDLGLCKPGEATAMVKEGATSLKGDFPVNTDGGLKADGHPIGATGVAQVYEAVLQLRREAGKRQVKCDSALTHNIGGVGGTAVVHVFGV
ncbi:thiolase domain-containing protein [Candidatus Micrarchaeota archaeon]|nr:thiolase domain-containing protein [Candidatus Micrarchaeota archaeon]